VTKGFLAVVAVVVAWASPVRANDDTSLAQARRDVESSDYMSARSDLVSALDGGTAGPEDLAEIYKLTGIVEAALGNTDGATAAFTKWLVLDPKAALPPGTSPKITRPFDAAAKKRPGKLEVKPDPHSDPPSIALAIENDPLHLVARVVAIVAADHGAEKSLSAEVQRGRAHIDLPKAKRLDVRVEALDEHGNRVALVGSRDLPIVITSEDHPEPTAKRPSTTGTTAVQARTEAPPHARPLALQWWLWGGIAVAAAGGATYFGMEARSAADEIRQLNATSPEHQFTDAQSVQSRGERDALLFNIGIASAGAFAAFAAILYVTQPRAGSETHVVAGPTAGGGAVLVEGRF